MKIPEGVMDEAENAYWRDGGTSSDAYSVVAEWARKELMNYEILQRDVVIATTGWAGNAMDIVAALQHEYPNIPFTYRRTTS